MFNLADCKFAHPASRPTPKGAKYPFTRPNTNGSSNGSMNKSKKFGVAATKPKVEEVKLDPEAGEFKPAEAVVQEKELGVTF